MFQSQARSQSTGEACIRTQVRTRYRVSSQVNKASHFLHTVIHRHSIAKIVSKSGEKTNPCRLGKLLKKYQQLKSFQTQARSQTTCDRPWIERQIADSCSFNLRREANPL